MRRVGRKHLHSGDPRTNSGLSGGARLVMLNVGKSKEHSKLSVRQQEIRLGLREGTRRGWQSVN